MSDDLRAFWDDSLRRLAEVPIDAEVEALSLPVAYRAFRLRLRSFGGVPIRAYFAIPAGIPSDAKFPAIVVGPGYGGRQMSMDLNESMRGYAILQVYPRGQGESGELWQVPTELQGQWLRVGAAAREGYYYQGGYLDLVRGIDWLLTRDDIDPQRIGLLGTSQAGAMALAAGAIDRRVAAVAVHVPFMSDMRRNPKFAGDLGRDEAFLRTYQSFDPFELAPLLHAPTLLSAGGKDPTSPPDTVRAVFDRLPGIRSLAWYPDQTHTTCADFYAMQWSWMERYVRSRR
jgi:cephalosporin-C deacetylase